MKRMDNLSLALKIASQAHAGQKDKAGATYIEHPIAVSQMVSGEQEKIVALLHDVLEDTEVKETEIRHWFGDVICDAVVAITRRPEESYKQFILRVKKNEIARTVKIADLKHNMNLSRLSEVTDQDLKRNEKYRKALAELTEDELAQVSGGHDMPPIHEDEKYVMQDFVRPETNKQYDIHIYK